jgi:hypothetical protein
MKHLLNFQIAFWEFETHMATDLMCFAAHDLAEQIICCLCQYTYAKTTEKGEIDEKRALTYGTFI